MAKNQDLVSRRNAAIPRGIASATPVYADRAENAELWDVEGKRYVDFAGERIDGRLQQLAKLTGLRMAFCFE